MKDSPLSAHVTQMENILRELIRFYHEDGKDPLITLPEIFGKQDQEVFVTYWLAYLLNPQTNGLGVEPLNALLRCVSTNKISNDEEVLVEREYTFGVNGRRIDLLITTSKFLIGIENKLYSGESDEQTKCYWSGMEKLLEDGLHKNKTRLGIYLKPQANATTPCSNNFQVVTYADLYKSLKLIDYDEKWDQRKVFFLKEFILYVEDKLMLSSETGFPEMREDVKLYHDNRIIIEKTKSNYDEFIKELGGWLNNYMKDLDNRFNAETPKVNYWQILEHDAWKSIDFHYELLWDKTDKRSILELTPDDKVYLTVHLEGAKSDRMKEFFGPIRGSTLYEEEVKVDFHDEANSKESVGRIVERLQSSDFQKYADIAYKYIQQSKSNVST
jgi:hypothetical protein